jgi:hypothetical protein
MDLKKKYNLKPGRHQFVPGSAAIHHNGNLTDDEAEWYIERYPHIITLFDVSTEEVEKQEAMSVNKSVQSQLPSITVLNSEIKLHENLSATN